MNMTDLESYVLPYIDVRYASAAGVEFGFQFGTEVAPLGTPTDQYPRDDLDWRQVWSDPIALYLDKTVNELLALLSTEYGSWIREVREKQGVPKGDIVRAVRDAARRRYDEMAQLRSAV